MCGVEFSMTLEYDKNSKLFLIAGALFKKYSDMEATLNNLSPKDGLVNIF